MTKKVVFNVSDEMHSAINKLKDEKSLNISNIMRKLLSNYLEREAKQMI